MAEPDTNLIHPSKQKKRCRRGFILIDLKDIFLEVLERIHIERSREIFCAVQVLDHNGKKAWLPLMVGFPALSAPS